MPTIATGFGICAIGNAIVDVLAHATEESLVQDGISKGTMTLIDEPRAVELYAKMKNAVQASGGSAANTIAGYASLGGAQPNARAAFMGKVRNDQLGEIFRHDMTALGVHFTTPPLTEGPATARCLVMVTPDGQRSMSTFLGAATEFSHADLEPELIQAAEVTYLEGYLFDKPQAQQAFFKTVRIARQAGKKMALTLSDPFCVQRHKEAFRDLISVGIDILFANQHELMALTETADVAHAVAAVRGQCKLLVATMSEHGAIICPQGQDPVQVKAEPVAKVVDTTGAGDQFAAGFLYGLTHGCDPASCARIGAIAAAEVISHFGPRPEKPLADLAQTVVAAAQKAKAS